MRRKILALLMSLTMVFACVGGVSAAVSSVAGEENVTVEVPEASEETRAANNNLSSELTGSDEAVTALQETATVFANMTAAEVREAVAKAVEEINSLSANDVSVKSLADLASGNEQEQAAAATINNVLNVATNASEDTSTSDLLASIAAATAAPGASAEEAQAAMTAAITEAVTALKEVTGVDVDVESLNVASVSNVSINMSEAAAAVLKASTDPNAGVEIAISTPELDNLPDNAVVVILQCVDGKWVNVPVKKVNGKIVGTFKSSGPIMVLTGDAAKTAALARLILASNEVPAAVEGVNSADAAANGGLVTSPQTSDVHLEGVLLLCAAVSGMALAYSLKRRETV